MAIVEKKWDGSPSRFTDAQWANSCLLDMGDCSTAAAKLTVKMRYKLPILEPNGDLNVAALGAAAAALAGARTPLRACPTAKQKAAGQLVAAYRRAKLEPPAPVSKLASA